MKEFLPGFLAAMNVAAFAAYGSDKYRSRHGQWRIRERTLLLLALLGGSAGAWLGMQVFRHKTQHLKFKYGVPVIFLIQLAGEVWF